MKRPIGTVRITHIICPCCKTPIRSIGKKLLRCPVCRARQVKTADGIAWEYSLFGNKAGKLIPIPKSNENHS